MADRKAQRQSAEANAVTFETIFQLWFDWWKPGKAEKHSAQVQRRVLADIVPALGASRLTT
jgi:hypothetical protein